MTFGIDKKNLCQFCSFSIKLLLLIFVVTIFFVNSEVVAGSDTDNTTYENSKESPKLQFNKIEELIFRIPDQQRTDTTKLEYKSIINLPSNNSWVIAVQPQSSSELLPKIIKKDDKNFLSILETNQYPTSTSKVVFDNIELVDINDNFYRIPNISTANTNDYLYLDKVNTVRNYKPDEQEIKNFDINKTSIIFLEKQENGYSSKLPKDKTYQIAMVQQKNGDNNWVPSKHQLISLTVDNNQALLEADQIIKNSKFDNQGYVLDSIDTAKAKSNNPSDNQNTGQSTPLANPNILPYVITIGSFGLINLIIRQYFTSSKK